MDALNNIKIEFPTSGLNESRDSFIMSCIGAFKTLKQGSSDFAPYEKHTVPFVSKYKDLSYDEFKKQALVELINKS